MEQLFIETEVEIENVVAFSQFIINNKLITIIGELHDKKFKCKNNPITLEEYVENRLISNDKACICLEFNKDTDKIGDLGSLNLKKIVRVLKKNNIHIPSKKEQNNKRIKSMDYRDYFFNSYNLYADDKYFLKLKPDRIIKEFVEPYFKLKKQFSSNGDFLTGLVNYKGNYDFNIDKRVFEYLEKVYIPSIENDFEEIVRTSLEEGFISQRQLLMMVRTVWAKVADFYIILEIFNTSQRLSPCNELIILFGNVHYHNLLTVLKYFNINAKTEQEKLKENCVKTKIFMPIFKI